MQDRGRPDLWGMAVGAAIFRIMPMFHYLESYLSKSIESALHTNYNNL